MKIGITYCGNSKMACFASLIGEWVKNTGLNIEYEAVTSLAAASFVVDGEFIFENYKNPDEIHASLLRQKQLFTGGQIATAVDISTGKHVSLCRDPQPCGGEFAVINNVTKGEWAVSCFAPFGNYKPHSLYNFKLCDSSIGWGCPYIPLAVMGVDRIISVVFTSQNPEYPYIISADKMIKRTSAICEFLIEPKDDDFTSYSSAKAYVEEMLEASKQPLLNKILFY